MRLLFAIIASVLLSACSQVDSLRELAKTEITVAAPRAEVFDTAFDVKDLSRGIPLVSNSGTDQLFELIVDENTPGWDTMKPDAVPFAKKIKVTLRLEDRREAVMRYTINDGDLRAGVSWQFEDVDGGGTKVSFDMLPLEGTRTEGLTINQLEMRSLARMALDKIEGMAKDRGGKVESING